MSSVDKIQSLPPCATYWWVYCFFKNLIWGSLSYRKGMSQVELNSSKVLLQGLKPGNAVIKSTLISSGNSCECVVWERGCGLSHINNKYLSSLIVRHYRHTSFYCTSLYCASQILCFFTSQRFVETPCQANLSVPFFQQHLLTLCPCIPFWQFLHHSRLFITIVFVMVIYDQRSLMLLL